MLKKFAAAVIAVSLIAGPALAQGSSVTPVTTKQVLLVKKPGQPTVKVVKHVRAKHYAKHHVKHVRHAKHFKHVKQVKRVKHFATGKTAG